MRVRKRYQDGGRTADLLAALERRRVANQLNSDMQDRMPQPSLAPASSTRVAMQTPNRSRLMGLDHPSFQPQRTISQESVNYEDPANIFKMIGAPMQTAAAMNRMIQSGEFRRPTTAEIEAAGSKAMDLPLAMTPIGDVSDILGAESAPEFALATGMAFLPGNLTMFKEWGDFNVMPEIGGKFQKVLDVIGQRGTTRDLVERNADLLRMPESTRRELAGNLEDMYDDISGFADQGELDKITEMASILRKGEIPDAKPAVPDIGDFMGEVDEAGGLVVRYENKKDPLEYMDVVRSSRDPNDNRYIMNVVAPNSDPLTRGKLMLAGMDRIPVGGVVDFLGDSRGLSNTMSADAYPIMFRFFRKGKAKPLLNEVKYSKLNKLGENSDMFAKTFGLDAKDAEYVDMDRIPKDVLERIVPKINAKLAEYGVPPVKKTPIGLEFPFFNIERTAKGFDKGGSFRVLKMKGGGNFRVLKQAPEGLKTKR